jgi:hypothetical protein
MADGNHQIHLGRGMPAETDIEDDIEIMKDVPSSH